MNDIIGYVLVALAVINLVGVLLLFRRVGHAPAYTSVAAAPAHEHRETVQDAAPAIDPDTLASLLRRLEIRLGDIEDQVRSQPVASIAGESGAATDRALALAQRLARQGATPQEIADTCGISLTEAELLHRLHAAR